MQTNVHFEDQKGSYVMRIRLAWKPKWAFSGKIQSERVVSEFVAKPKFYLLGFDDLISEGFEDEDSLSNCIKAEACLCASSTFG